jgi:hypothetical protein
MPVMGQTASAQASTKNIGKLSNTKFANSSTNSIAKQLMSHLSTEPTWCFKLPQLQRHSGQYISLQNCLIKAIAKVLTNRLQPHIPSLIHPDQTGFVKGRSIAKNFNYVADLLNYCHKRKVPTMLIKLDLRKAFDLVSWVALNQLLITRGFPPIFCNWIQNILLTGPNNNPTQWGTWPLDTMQKRLETR